MSGAPRQTNLSRYLPISFVDSLFPVRGLTVKIGAIEQRTTLQVASERGDYTGIELGADVAADINLDDFMVFENDARRATEFFQELLYRHYKSAAEDLGQTEVLPNSDELIRQPLLTSSPIPEALVHAESAAVLGRCASQIIASSSARFLAE